MGFTDSISPHKIPFYIFELLRTGIFWELVSNLFHPKVYSQSKAGWIKQSRVDQHLILCHCSHVGSQVAFRGVFRQTMTSGGP